MPQLNELSQTDRDYIMVEFTRGTPMDRIAWRVDRPVEELMEYLKRMGHLDDIDLMERYYGAGFATDNPAREVNRAKGSMWFTICEIESDRDAS